MEQTFIVYVFPAYPREELPYTLRHNPLSKPTDDGTFVPSLFDDALGRPGDEKARRKHDEENPVLLIGPKPGYSFKWIALASTIPRPKRGVPVPFKTSRHKRHTPLWKLASELYYSQPDKDDKYYELAVPNMQHPACKVMVRTMPLDFNASVYYSPPLGSSGTISLSGRIGKTQFGKKRQRPKPSTQRKTFRKLIRRK